MLSILTRLWFDHTWAHPPSKIRTIFTHFAWLRLKTSSLPMRPVKELSKTFKTVIKRRGISQKTLVFDRHGPCFVHISYKVGLPHLHDVLCMIWQQEQGGDSPLISCALLCAPHCNSPRAGQTGAGEDHGECTPCPWCHWSRWVSAWNSRMGL